MPSGRHPRHLVPPSAHPSPPATTPSVPRSYPRPTSSDDSLGPTDAYRRSLKTLGSPCRRGSSSFVEERRKERRRRGRFRMDASFAVVPVRVRSLAASTKTDPNPSIVDRSIKILPSRTAHFILLSQGHNSSPSFPLRPPRSSSNQPNLPYRFEISTKDRLPPPPLFTYPHVEATSVGPDPNQPGGRRPGDERSGLVRRSRGCSEDEICLEVEQEVF